MRPEKLDSISEGFRSLLIGLDYLDKDNPQKALVWFGRSRSYNPGPHARFGEHLSYLRWKEQRLSVLGNLRLDKYFTPLARYNDAFSAVKMRRHLDSCGVLFEKTRLGGYLPGPISGRYLETIHLSSAAERRAGIAWVKRELALNPGNTARWDWLNEAAAWENDSALQVKACSSSVNLDPDNVQMRLTLARLLVRLGDIDKAESAIAYIGTDSVTANPDYLFCLGAVAEHKGSLKEAQRLYKACCDMRRYDPDNFIAHARISTKLGKADEAKKALAWAAIISPTGAPSPAPKETDEQTGK
jgi:tetratricopeptide (TPR) repeat protein